MSRYLYLCEDVKDPLQGREPQRLAAQKTSRACKGSTETDPRGTEDDYVDTVRLHLVPALGRKRLAKLTVADLDKLWKAKRDAGYSSNSVRIMRTVLRRALGQAVREGIVSRNVAALSTAPRIRARQGRTLTVEQAQQLLDAAAGYRFEAAVVLALAYGMRRGRGAGFALVGAGLEGRDARRDAQCEAGQGPGCILRSPDSPGGQ
jgi:hypothetical protein